MSHTFQSTLPHGSDNRSKSNSFFVQISIHAPSRERLQFFCTNSQEFYFNPRSLTGATWTNFIPLTFTGFQSTLPHGSDATTRRLQHKICISIHAPSRERRHQNKILLHSFKSSIYCELAQFKSLKILF